MTTGEIKISNIPRETGEISQYSIDIQADTLLLSTSMHNHISSDLNGVFYKQIGIGHTMQPTLAGAVITKDKEILAT